MPMPGFRALQLAALLCAAVAVLVSFVPARGSLPELTRAQSHQQVGGTPTFNALEDDYRRLRVGPFFAKIQGTLTYCVDKPTGPVDLGHNQDAVKQAFETWDNELGNNLFKPAKEDAITDCTGAAGMVGWGSLGPGVVGQTTFVFGSPDFSTKTIPVTGFVITLNSDIADWAVDAGGGKYGVKDVIIHEAGHVLGLDDLNPLTDMCLTMFRAAFTSDKRMQTLGLGDKLGAHAIYGGTPTDTAPECES